VSVGMDGRSKLVLVKGGGSCSLHFHFPVPDLDSLPQSIQFQRRATNELTPDRTSAKKIAVANVNGVAN